MNKRFEGLNPKEVEESIETFGTNVIIESEPDTFFDKFLEAFGDPMIKLLLAIACIMTVLAIMGYAEFGEILGIVISILLVTGISAKTEVSSDKEYRKLKNSVKKESYRVIRNDESEVR